MSRLTRAESSYPVVEDGGILIAALDTADLVDLITHLCSAIECRLSCEHDLPTVVRQDCRDGISSVREDAQGIARALRLAQEEARRVAREQERVIFGETVLSAGGRSELDTCTHAPT